MINKNKIYLIVVFLFLILAVIFYPKNKPEIVNFKIENKTYKVLIADSKDEWSKGLMNVKELKEADGMMFIFPEKQFRVFWNKNTLLDLDVYWIADEKIISKSYLPSINQTAGIVRINSPVPVNKVVEIIRN